MAREHRDRAIPARLVERVEEGQAACERQVLAFRTVFAGACAAHNRSRRSGGQRVDTNSRGDRRRGGDLGRSRGGDRPRRLGGPRDPAGRHGPAARDQPAGAAASLPGDALVEHRHFGGSRGPGLRRFHRLRQRRRSAASPSRFRRHARRRRVDLRVPVHRGRRRAGQKDRAVRSGRRERRRRSLDRDLLPVLSDPRRGDHAAALGRRRRSRQCRPDLLPGSPHADARPRPPPPLRALQRVVRRRRLAGVLRRVLRHEHERPPARRLDVRGRGRARDPSRSRPLRRGLRGGRKRRRDPSRLPLHGASHQGLRVPRFASGRLPGPAGAADGRSPEAEARDGHFGIRSGDPENLPGDEDVRAHRRRQRHRHVRQRYLGRALGQRRPQPGLRVPHGLRLRGHPARLEAAARAGSRRRRARGRRRVLEPERRARARRVRDRRAVVGEPRGRRRFARRSRLQFRGPRGRELHDRRRGRGLRLAGGGSSGELLERDRELLSADDLESRDAAGTALGRGGHGEGQRDGREDVDAARGRQLRRCRGGGWFLFRDREPLPQRRHRGLQCRQLLPGLIRHARADGGLSAEVEARPRIPAAAGGRDGFRRRAGERFRRRVDRGSRRQRDRGRMRGRALLPGCRGDAGADGGLPAEGAPRQRLRPARGRRHFRRRPAFEPLRALDRAARRGGRHRRLRRRKLLSRLAEHARADGGVFDEDVRA